MHELSIAQGIVEIVEQHVAATDLPLVREVKMKIGEMAGVVPESLDFCYSAIVAETALQHSKLLIEFIPFRLECRTCANIFTSSLGLVQCPECQSMDTMVLGGTELNVTEIEVAEPLEVA